MRHLLLISTLGLTFIALLSSASICVKRGMTEHFMVVGPATFRDLMTYSTMFVDKTLFIKDFLDEPARVVLVTCPRRWGKSLNMDMVREFLQMPQEEAAQQAGSGGSYDRRGMSPLAAAADRAERFSDQERLVLARKIETLPGSGPLRTRDFRPESISAALHQPNLTSVGRERSAFKASPSHGSHSGKLSSRRSGSLSRLTGFPDGLDGLDNLFKRKAEAANETGFPDGINSLFKPKAASNKTGPSNRTAPVVSAYQLFTEGETESGNYSRLAIAEHPEVIAEHLGQHPVLHLSLLVPFGGSFAAILQSLQLKLAQVYAEHTHAFEAAQHDPWWEPDPVLGEPWHSEPAHRDTWEDSEYVMRDPWRDPEAGHHDPWRNPGPAPKEPSRGGPVNPGEEMLCKLRAQNATEAELAGSLRVLSKLLHERYAARVFVLIDDYDTPLNLMFARYTGDSRECRRVVEFFARFFEETFSNNPHVERGLVTGINTVAVAELFARVDYEHHSMLHSQVARHYGFSESEVTHLLHEKQIPLGMSAKAKRYYAGYAVGDRSRLCNPWDVAQFLKRPKLLRWWSETGGSGFFDVAFKLGPLAPPLLTLISRSNLEIPLLPALSTAQFAKLKDMLAARTPFDASGVNLFLSFVFSAGYLTVDKDVIRLGAHRQKNSLVAGSSSSGGHLHLETLLMIEEDTQHEQADEVKQPDGSSLILDDMNGGQRRFQTILTGTAEGQVEAAEVPKVWVRLPNEEIASELTDVLLRHYDSLVSLRERGTKVEREIYAEFQELFNNGSTAKFKESLESFLRIHPAFSDDSAVRAALNHVILSIRVAGGEFFLKTGREGEGKTPRRPALAAADTDVGLGIILELEYGIGADGVLRQAEKYLEYLSDRRVKRVRFVGIGVFPNKTVSIKDTYRSRN